MEPASKRRPKGLVLASAGVLIGLGGSALAGGLLAAVLFQTRTTDVVATGLAALVLIASALAACVAPAHRAAHVAPMDALRD